MSTQTNITRKHSIIINAENMTTLDKTKYKQCLPTHQALQKLLKGKVKAKEVNYIQKKHREQIISDNSDK